MAAHTDPQATRDFADSLLELAGYADEYGQGVDIQIDDAAEAGWLVPAGEQLVVTIDGVEYLITVRAVDA